MDLNIQQRGRQNQGTVSALWTVSSHWHDHPFKKKPETLISAIYHNVQQGSPGPLRSQMVRVGPGTSSVSILGSHGHPEPRLSVTVYGPAAAGPNQIYPEKNSVKNSGQGDQVGPWEFISYQSQRWKKCESPGLFTPSLLPSSPPYPNPTKHAPSSYNDYVPFTVSYKPQSCSGVALRSCRITETIRSKGQGGLGMEFYTQIRIF